MARLTTKIGLAFLLGSLNLLAACEEARVVIVAWPSMTAEEFNHLNQDSSRQLSTTGTDWIGVEAPVDLFFQQGQQTVIFEDPQGGGGLQVASRPENYNSNGEPTGTPRVTTIWFGLGTGMLSLQNEFPILEQHCRALSEMAGTTPAAIPSSGEMSHALAASEGRYLREATICRGEGELFSYELRASHVVGDRQHGGDFAYAFIQGWLGLPSSHYEPETEHASEL